MLERNTLPIAAAITYTQPYLYSTQKLSGCCYHVITDNPRVTCVDLIICSVYMPWDDKTLEQAINYEATIGCLQSIVDRHIGCVFPVSYTHLTLPTIYSV